MKKIEKWNSSTIFSGKIPKVDKDKYSGAIIKETFQVEQLAKTAREIEIIEEVLMGYDNLFLQHEHFNQAPLKVLNEQILILSDEEFNKIGHEIGGKAQYGYCYLQRLEDEEIFQDYLAHEIAHVHSFNRIRVSAKAGVYRIGLEQSGFYRKNRYFLGLNEAATETIAKIALSFNGIDSRVFSYFDCVMFLEAILVTSENPEIIDLMTASYFDGSDKFLDAMEKEFPRSKEALKVMGTSLESVQKAEKRIANAKISEYFNLMMEDKTAAR